MAFQHAQPPFAKHPRTVYVDADYILTADDEIVIVLSVPICSPPGCANRVPAPVKVILPQEFSREVNFPGPRPGGEIERTPVSEGTFVNVAATEFGIVKAKEDILVGDKTVPFVLLQGSNAYFRFSEGRWRLVGRGD